MTSRQKYADYKFNYFFILLNNFYGLIYIEIKNVLLKKILTCILCPCALIYSISVDL